MPDAHAWGTSIKNYVGSEYVDNDGEGITDKHRMIAEAEEEEGIATQKRLLDQLDEDALDFDIFPTQETGESGSRIVTVTKLDKLSKEDRLEYLKKESPELFLLIDDYKRLMNESENKIGAAIQELTKVSDQIKQDDLFQFMCVKKQLIMRYCLNINFYLALKCRGKQTKQHPVRQTLILYRKMLKEVQEYQSKLGYATVEQLIEQIKKNVGRNRLESKTIIADRKKKSGKRVTIQGVDSDEEEADERWNVRKAKKSGSMSLHEEVEAKRTALQKAEGKLKQMEKDAEYYSDEHQDEKEVLFVHKRDDVKKRKISRMIEKNKGLTPYRRKDLRNPRLRYKSKFVKAEKKRRSQVSDPVKEINRYAGEFHGIKAATVRSVKIKQ
jgi:U3 small nucleolar RNA-associated protein 3